MSKWKMFAVALFVTALGAVSACSYAGVAAVDEDTVVVTKNNAFLFGLLNKVYVCQVTDSGITNCSKRDSP